MANLLNTRYFLSCNSGSSANLLAISALCSEQLGDKKLKEGDDKHLIIYKEKNGDIPNYNQFLKLWGNRGLEK